MALKLFARNKIDKKKAGADSSSDKSSPPPRPKTPSKQVDYQPAPPENLDDNALMRMLDQGRYAAIIRDRDLWEGHGELEEVVKQATGELERRMAIVPAGLVAIPTTLVDQPGAPEEESDVEPFLLCVHAVTNAEYQRFVDDGGYESLEYWPEDIWPHLIEFKDLTDNLGPACWRGGRHDQRFGDHPVVGVSWIEAQAYSLWIGLRLPTDVEWQVAASWGIKSAADIHRRFPWGDAMDNTRCNIWSTRLGHTAPVSAYPTGASPNRIMQLVGNVWEWTATEFDVTDESGRPILGEMIMQAIRGGAFDTYFETQATAQFRTGLIALSRAHNVGFRCAMDLGQATWVSGE